MSPTPKAQRLRDRLTINPDELPPAPRPAPAAVAPDPPAPTVPAAEVAEPEAAPESEPRPQARPRPRTGGRPRQRSASPLVHVSALDDPSITPGRKDYRSFYIEDATFARFRAAIYWLSRREDATEDVPENMSVAVETWMQETANELEQRYNDGATFRMPPASRRRRSTP